MSRAEACMHACMRKQSNQTPKYVCALTPPSPSCTCAWFPDMSFGLVQAEYRFSHSLQIFPFITIIYRSGRTHLSIHSLRRGVLLHHTLWRHGIVSLDALLLLARHILLVCHLLVFSRCHSVTLCHPAASWHACLWSWELRVVDVFRGVDS